MNIQILANILKFLERVNVSGSEAYAWCDAHSYIRNEITQLAQAQTSAQSQIGTQSTGV